MKKKKEEVKFYICPNCKSTKVKYTFNFRSLFGMLPTMRCGNCGTKGMFPMIVTTKSQLKKMEEKKKKKVKKKSTRRKKR